MIKTLQFSHLQNITSLRHFVSTRGGGVSEGEYASLNLGHTSGDSETNILTNRELFAQHLEVLPTQLFIPTQTHGNTIVCVDDVFLSQTKQEQDAKLHGVDALITNVSGICIGVTTADCVPLLLYDSHKHVLAAVHAGWRGTLTQIAASTVRKMVSAYNCSPQNILVGIAPAISAEHFEVGKDVEEAFKQANISLHKVAYRHSESHKLHINLQLLNKIQLEEAGIPERNIEILEMCTYAHRHLFFSARRQGIHSGRMLTGGMLI